MSAPRFTPGPWSFVVGHVFAESHQACGVYVGDNDGTCPGLTCVRSRGHLGPHDNVRGDDENLAVAQVRLNNSVANARLIAAAPDLYAALEVLLATFGTPWLHRGILVCSLCGGDDETPGRHHVTCRYEAACAALAKARGE